MARAEVKALAKYLPEEVLENTFFLEKTYRNPKTGVLDFRTTLDFILEKMGPETRRRSRPDEFSADMAAEVAQQLVAHPNPETAHRIRDSIEGIIIATVTPNRGFPSTAALVQERIGARNVQVAKDVAAACAGFPIILDEARRYIETGSGSFLVIASETLTKIVDYEDRNCALFGDGAGGALLVPTSEHRGVLAAVGRSDPFNGKALWIYNGAPTLNDALPEGKSDGFRTGKLYMPQGPKVLKDAIEAMKEGICAVARKAGWELRDVDLVIAHQANIRILNVLTDRLAKELPPERVYNNIRKYGNMSAPTCAIAAAEAQEEGRIRQGSRVILSSYGSGTIAYSVAIQF